jgi:hypothetical protein
MVRWGEFAGLEPGLAAFGVGRLSAVPAYLATIRRSGEPRVHPVTPVFTDDGLFVFMEPSSPKGADLRSRGHYALHNGVPDNNGTGGEFHVSGGGVAVVDPDVRLCAVRSASFAPADRYILFELLVTEARATGYGDVELPAVCRWSRDERT